MGPMGRLSCYVRGKRGGKIKSNVGVRKCQRHSIRFQGQVFEVEERVGSEVS